LVTLNKNIKLILNYFVGPLLFCLLVFSIISQLKGQPDWKISLQRIWTPHDNRSFILLFFVFCLMLLNWGIEARKWQLAIRNIQRLTFFRAYKATFTGTTLAFFTPNRMGEYMGRIFFIEKGKRIKAISLTIVCSMAQLLVTLAAGFIGASYLKGFLLSKSPGHDSGTWINVIMLVSAAALVVLSVFYFRLRWITSLIAGMPQMNKYVAYVKVLDNFNATILLRILSLCVFRYCVFVFQYYLLFQLFGVEVNWWQTFWSISVVFVILAIVPSIAILTELGIRWKASIELVTLFSSNVTGILATSLAIWIINLVIPALIGSLLILGIKFYKKV